MFFESGEEEIKKEFNMPFNDKKAKDWLFNYLNEVLDNAKIVPIGEFDAGNYAHYKIKNIKRTVFKISRK